MIEGYNRLYRTLDALACLEQWFARDPDNLRALELRGIAYQNAKQTRKASEDFRKVIARDPTRAATRWRLALCLLDAGGYVEALPHLEQIAREKPGDPDVLARAARCHAMLDRNELARQMLDAVLEQHPDHALSLRTRGQFALADQQPDRAERWLRRAVAAWPDDYQSQYLLYQALSQQNKVEAAADQLKTAEAAKERAERLGDLTSRRLYEQPMNPALHYEMGVLLLRGGHTTAAVGWLLSALSLEPNYQPAHAELAKYYASQGDEKRADEHRRKSESK